MQWNKGRVKNQGIESITWIIFSTEFVLILAAEKTGSVVPLAMFFSMIALSQATRLGSGKGIAAEHIATPKVSRFVHPVPGDLHLGEASGCALCTLCRKARNQSQSCWVGLMMVETRAFHWSRLIPLNPLVWWRGSSSPMDTPLVSQRASHSVLVEAALLEAALLEAQRETEL